MRDGCLSLRSSGVGTPARRTLAVVTVAAAMARAGWDEVTAGEIRRATSSVTKTVTSAVGTVHTETAFDLSVSDTESVDTALPQAAENAANSTAPLSGE